MNTLTAFQKMVKKFEMGKSLLDFTRDNRYRDFVVDCFSKACIMADTQRRKIFDEITRAIANKEYTPLTFDDVTTAEISESEINDIHDTMFEIMDNLLKRTR